MMRSLFLFFLGAILFFVFFLAPGRASSPVPERPKIACADMKKVFKNSQEIKKVEEWLKKKHHALENKIKKYKVDLKNFQEKIKILNPESKLYEETRWQMEAKALELKNFVLLQTRRLRKEYAERLKRGLEKTQKKVRGYLQREGYLLFFNLSPSDSEKESPVFYHHAKIDLTQKLIEIFR